MSNILPIQLLKKGYKFIRKIIFGLFKKKPKENCQQKVPKVQYSDGSWLTIEVTPDQKRIVNYLESLAPENKHILHVGTGNSSFGQQFSIKNKVDSITVMEDELTHAHSLNLPNYNCYLLNKYADDLKRLKNKYDFIVDNNPSSFACCKVHFIKMMHHYSSLLNNKGAIITDTKGMAYHQSFAFPVTVEELKQLFPDLLVKTSDCTVIITKNE